MSNAKRTTVTGIAGAGLALFALVLPLESAQADHCGCEPPPPAVSLPGRMTGGGSIFDGNDERVTHGFQLRCDITDPRQNLEINWGDGNSFHLTSLDSVSCTNDPAIDQGQPFAVIDTFSAVGEGRCNGEDGATVLFTFQDAGEPGENDFADITITGCPVDDLEASGLLDMGNHQAHLE